jgi:hypothetical protein
VAVTFPQLEVDLSKNFIYQSINSSAIMFFLEFDDTIYLIVCILSYIYGEATLHCNFIIAQPPEIAGLAKIPSQFLNMNFIIVAYISEPCFAVYVC